MADEEEKKQQQLQKFMANKARSKTNPLRARQRPQAKPVMPQASTPEPAGPAPATPAPMPSAAEPTPATPSAEGHVTAAPAESEDLTAREKRRIEEERQRHEDLYERVRAGQDENDQLRDEIEKLKKENAAHVITKSKLSQEKSDHANTKKRLQESDNRFKNFQTQINNQQKQIANHGKEIADKNKELETVKSDWDKANKGYLEAWDIIAERDKEIGSLQEDSGTAWERADENEAAARTLQETLETFKELFEEHGEHVGIEKYVAIVKDEHQRLKAQASQESFDKILQNGQPQPQAVRHASTSLSDELTAKAVDSDAESSTVDDETPEEPTLTKLPTPPKAQDFSIILYPGVSEAPISPQVECKTSTSVGTQTESDREAREALQTANTLAGSIFRGIDKAPTMPQTTKAKIDNAQAKPPASYAHVTTQTHGNDTPQGSMKSGNYKDVVTQTKGNATPQGDFEPAVLARQRRAALEAEKLAETFAELRAHDIARDMVDDLVSKERQKERDEMIKKQSITIFPGISIEPTAEPEISKHATAGKQTSTRTSTSYEVWMHLPWYMKLLLLLLFLALAALLLGAWGEREVWLAANDTTRRHVLGLMAGEGNGFIDMVLYGLEDITGYSAGSALY